jgi:hypothetical protein
MSGSKDGRGGTGASDDGEAELSLEDALRHRAASALEAGLAFIERHGDALAVLRVHALLGVCPVADCVSEIARRVGPDGAVAPLGLAVQGAPGLADLLDGPGTAILGPLEALIALADLGALHAPCVEDIARRLGVLQHDDGSWGDLQAPAPTRIFATGLLAGQLSRTRVARPELLDRAGRFLASMWSPDRVSGRAWPAIAGFGAWYSSTGDDLADEALQWIGRELQRGNEKGVYDAVHTVRVLLHCDASAVPGAALVPAALLEALLDEQAADGGFAELTPGPDAVRVVPTLDAMLGAIRLCGVI